MLRSGARVEWSGLVLANELKDDLISVSMKSDRVYRARIINRRHSMVFNVLCADQCSSGGLYR